MHRSLKFSDMFGDVDRKPFEQRLEHCLWQWMIQLGIGDFHLQRGIAFYDFNVGNGIE